MARRTMIIAALLFIAGAAGIVTNLESWSTVLGTSSVPAKDGSDPVETDLPAPGPAPLPPPTPTENGDAASGPTDPPAGEGPPPSGVDPETSAGSALDAALTSLIERVERRFSAAPDDEPAPRRLTPFHTGAEALAGVSLDELLEEAQRRRVEPEPVIVTPEPVGPPPEDPSAVGRQRVMAASLSGILRGADWALCVIDGQRLKIGDPLPGTTWRVASIGEREIHLTDGTDTLRKDLDSLRRESSGAGAGSGSHAPEEQN